MNKHVVVPYEKYQRMLRADPTPTEEAVSLKDTDIIEAVPKPYRQRVKILLPYFNWNDRGELLTSDGPVPGSHMADLMRYTQYPYKEAPVGLSAFISQLHQTPLHKGLIMNKTVLESRPPGIPKITTNQKRTSTNQKTRKRPIKWKKLY
ncbi:MAG: hypothetical protein MJA29_01440 [Candidatus Omnitrophica bacterium]|nr:hypothetical protein [Candidatus Omnitrophota bacterium]